MPSDPATEADFGMWPHVVRQGSGPVLLLLHGTGSSEHDILSLADGLDPDSSLDFAVIAPRGQVSENGALRWFRRLGEGVFDVEDVERRASDLAAFVQWAVEHYGFEGRRMLASGFSNGSNMATALAVLHPGVVRETIAFSGMYPFADTDIAGDLAGSRFLLLNGDSDAMAPSASVDRLVSQLEKHEARVTRVTRAGGHGITAEELARAADWAAAD